MHHLLFSCTKAGCRQLRHQLPWSEDFTLDASPAVQLYKGWVSTVETPTTMARRSHLDDSVIACSDDDVLHGVMQNGQDF